MSTNPTHEHGEQAREIVDSFTSLLYSSSLIDVEVSYDHLKNSIAKSLSSRDTEVREVLEGLITCTLDEGNGPQLHWCPIGEDSNMECGPSCVAAQLLYAKLQPPEKSLPGE